ncbi:Ladderlectin Precursor [Channa argus]|uniref:Ladderlectin n=1 Tax=Channa argus TaxID=215402 RepID=A0A6G1Q6M3_CHAAH|nr:Ladderlectin Precursor [Channa argus]
MKVICVFLSLCTFLTLSLAVPLNTTYPWGQCEDDRQNCSKLIGAFCPQCDSKGNFLPKQCWASTGYCWCVNIFSGNEIPNTRIRPGTKLNCEKRCPDGWKNYGDKCFIFIDTPKRWTEAEVYCRFDGANLASIHSEEENYFITSLTRGDTHNFPQSWLGGFDVIESATSMAISSHSSARGLILIIDIPGNAGVSMSSPERRYQTQTHPRGPCLLTVIYCQFDDANLASVHSEEENRFIMSLTRGDTQTFPQTWLGGFDVIHSVTSMAISSHSSARGHGRTGTAGVSMSSPERRYQTQTHPWGPRLLTVTTLGPALKDGSTLEKGVTPSSTPRRSGLKLRASYLIIIIIIPITMKVLIVSITLCMILTLSCAMPLNSTLCQDRRQNCINSTRPHDGYCPKCDNEGNFLPQQCARSNGYCWCVNVTSGLQIPNTVKPLESLLDCDGDSHDCPDGWSSFGKRCFIFIDSPKSWVDAEVYCQFDKANLASVHSPTENHFIMSLTGDGLQWFYASCHASLPFVCVKNIRPEQFN